MAKEFLIVHGIVQSVGYRSFVKAAADRNFVRGFVKNLEDGSVCVLAEGERKDIEVFKKEIDIDSRNGPQVFSIEIFLEGAKGFPDLLGKESKIFEIIMTGFR